LQNNTANNQHHNNRKIKPSREPTTHTINKKKNSQKEQWKTAESQTNNKQQTITIT